MPNKTNIPIIFILDESFPLPEEVNNWVICGICLHARVAPVLRKQVKITFEDLYEELKTTNDIHCQYYPNVLLNYRKPNGYELMYEHINDNKGMQKSDLNYHVNSAVDLSKLFLRQLEDHYHTFDDCDLTVLLNLVRNCSAFMSALRTSAEHVSKLILLKFFLV